MAVEFDFDRFEGITGRWTKFLLRLRARHKKTMKLNVVLAFIVMSLVTLTAIGYLWAQKQAQDILIDKALCKPFLVTYTAGFILTVLVIVILA